MGKVDTHRDILRKLKDWDQYLLDNSCLPGPRADLELVEAVAEEGDPEIFYRYIEYDTEKAPVGSAHEFLAMCGTVGLGRLIAQGNKEDLKTLRISASDTRWRVREAVAMALQRFGESDMEGLLTEMTEWMEGNPLEKRAVVAALCEPKILKETKDIDRVLEILDKITHDIPGERDRKNNDFKALRKALGYGWSVVIVANPEKGKTMLEKWFFDEDKDIRWIMKENLRKERLKRVDSEWTNYWKLKLGVR